MGKNKLQRFEENKTFPHLFQAPFQEMENSFVLKGRWAEDFFKNQNPIILELGCGKGEYSQALAQKYPDKNFIGIDIKGARLWRGCKNTYQLGLQNVAFLRTHVQLVERFFANDEVSEIWITFPDPQPKKPNKRLTSQRFLSLYSKILKPDGIIHLKTDNADLFDFTLEVIQQNAHQIELHSRDIYSEQADENACSVQTFYEQMFLSQGMPIHYLRFKLNPLLQ